MRLRVTSEGENGGRTVKFLEAISGFFNLLSERMSQGQTSVNSHWPGDQEGVLYASPSRRRHSDDMLNRTSINVLPLLFQSEHFVLAKALCPLRCPDFYIPRAGLPLPARR